MQSTYFNYNKTSHPLNVAGKVFHTHYVGHQHNIYTKFYYVFEKWDLILSGNIIN